VKGIIGGTARAAVEQAKILGRILKGADERYEPFRSAFFKFADVNVAIIGKTKGRGEWLDERSKVFYEGEKIVGAVVFDNIRKALKLERAIRGN